MYIDRVPNRKSPPAVLLRESYREDGKVKKRTIANLSKWPDHIVEGLRVLLKGGVALPSLDLDFSILRTRPHGHVAAALGSVRRLGLEKLLDGRRSPERAQACGMIVERILDPGSTRAAARSLDEETAIHTLGEELAISEADEDDLDRALDWLLRRQDRVQRRLAAERIGERDLALCAVARVRFTGAAGQGKSGFVLALLCDREGCPVAVETFEGDDADPATVAARLETLRERLALSRVALVGAGGPPTADRIRAEAASSFDRIAALTAGEIRDLVDGGDLPLSLFDERDPVEVAAPESLPGERLIARRDPTVAAKRARTRRERLAAVEAELDEVAAAVRRDDRPLRGRAEIAVQADRALRRHRVGKHFDVESTDDSFTWTRDEDGIATEAAADGIHAVRATVPPEGLSPEDAIRFHERAIGIGRAFRSEAADLAERPADRRSEDRVRAHVFLRMLAHHVEWRMRRALAPLLLDSESRGAPDASSARPSRSAADGKRAQAGFRARRFRTLLADLASLTRSRVQPHAEGVPAGDVISKPTPLQAEALGLLDVDP